MTHAFYVYGAWGAAAVILLGLIAATWIESARMRQELKRLEAQGIRRRSTDAGAKV